MNEFFSRVYRRSLNTGEKRRRDKSGDGGVGSDQLKVFTLETTTERRKRERERGRREEKKKRKRKGCFPGLRRAGRTWCALGPENFSRARHCRAELTNGGFIGGMRVWIRVNGWFMLYNLFSIEE